MVEREDIYEAIRLIEMSKDTLDYDLDRSENVTRTATSTDKIFKIIRDIFEEQENREISIDDAIDKCLSRGYSNKQIEETIEEYEVLNVWQVNQARTKVTLV